MQADLTQRDAGDEGLVFYPMSAARLQPLRSICLSQSRLHSIWKIFIGDTNELIAPFLEGGLALATVAQRVRGYFKHGEAKSQGSVGLLTRKCVAGLSKVWIGKESHPLADVEDLPGDETLEHYRTDTIVTSELSCNGNLVKHAGIDRVAKASRVDNAVLSNASKRKRLLSATVLSLCAARGDIKKA